jgi:NADH:ubiquinone oxidoreductase subunit 6 (subunit J)
MIFELLAVGLVVSAFLAVQLDDAVYSVISLAGTLMLMAILYSLSNATYVAVFQLAIGVGTLAILFLSSDMLSEAQDKKKSLRSALPILVVAFALSIPSIFLSVGAVPIVISPEISFPVALWDLRSIDIVLQGLVILTVALGIALILREKKEETE